MKRDKFAGLRESLLQFRNDRERIKEESATLKDEVQPSLIEALTESQVGSVGLVIDPDDPKKGAAFIQQNEPTTVWDDEAILDWLNKPVNGRRALLRKTQSTVFDINKWEALVGSKEVPPKVAQRFQKKLPPSKPFIRFGKNDKDSL